MFERSMNKKSKEMKNVVLHRKVACLASTELVPCEYTRHYKESIKINWKSLASKMAELQRLKVVISKQKANYKKEKHQQKFGLLVPIYKD